MILTKMTPSFCPILILFNIFLFSAVFSNCLESEQHEQTIFNFTSVEDVDGWVEQSDTVRDVGMSKAVLTLQKTNVFQRAVFFALLNLQTNGAGFAGVRILDSFNLTDFTTLNLKCRGQGQFYGYKMVLRHQGLNDGTTATYEQYFQAPTEEFETVSLPFSDFKPYYRGQLVNSTELDVSQISAIGFQMYGGVYQNITQYGPGTLEIDWLTAAV